MAHFAGQTSKLLFLINFLPIVTKSENCLVSSALVIFTSYFLDKKQCAKKIACSKFH
jgi:hypothetical protein